MVTKTLQFVPLKLEHKPKFQEMFARVDGEVGLPIVEIFKTLEGEGLEIGTPRTLVRVGGCSVGCFGCDTPHTWSLKASKMMTFDEILDAINEADPFTTVVSLTGGEPMHYPAKMLELVEKLHDECYTVSLETSGMLINHEVFSAFDKVSLDIKTPSSKVEVTRANLAAIGRVHATHRGCQVKAIVTDNKDLQWLQDYVLRDRNFQFTQDRPLILTPAAGKGATAQSISKKCQMIQDANLEGWVRVIPQVHVLLGFR